MFQATGSDGVIDCAKPDARRLWWRRWRRCQFDARAAGDANADTHSHADANTYSRAHADTYSDAHTDADTNTYSYSHSHSHSHADTDTDTYADADADADANENCREAHGQYDVRRFRKSCRGRL
jgi:cobalamin biosynthesis protein CobT